MVSAVWHSQLPDWVENINDPDELTQTIEDHISTVMGRWAGKVAKWVRYAFVN